MRKHIPYLLWLAFSVGFILLFAFDGRADDFNGRADGIRLFYANTSAWKSDAVISAPNGATLPPRQLYPPQTIPVGGSLLIEGFGAQGFGVETVAIDGVRAWTEASFNDGKDTNSVEIPPLPKALDASGVYTLWGIESVQRGRSTYIAFVSDGPAVVTIDVFDGANQKVGSEGVALNGFAFYKLSTSVLLGRAEIRLANAQNFGWPTNGKVYAVAFIGRESGKPRVEVPTLKGTN